MHHIEALDDGGDPYDAENLTVLCRSCHIDSHRRQLSAPEQAWADRVAAIRDP